MVQSQQQQKQQDVFLVSKANVAEYVLGTVPAAPLTLALAPSSVRVRPSLISLTSNNLTYAQGGAAPPLFWWDAYPVPSNTTIIPSSSSSLETDLNTIWGIVPAWGYATVLASTVPSLAPGSLLWGFWPASGHTVDLALEPTGVGKDGNNKADGTHYREMSPHRARLMTLYNDYIQRDPSSTAADLTHHQSQYYGLEVLCRTVFVAGYVLNRYIFPDSSSSSVAQAKKPIHPLGVPGFGEDVWTMDKKSGSGLASLAGTVVVSLGAGTKTGRAFAWCLLGGDRAQGKAAVGPLAVVQVSSAPETLLSSGGKNKGGVVVRNVTYDEFLGGSVVEEEIVARKPERVVVADFGAKGEVLDKFVQAVKEREVSVLVVAVGTESKVYSDEEMQAYMESKERLGKEQMNTSGVIDRAVEMVGADNFHRRVDEAWKRCVEEKGLGDVKTVVFNGVTGKTGIESAWKSLCQMKLAANAGIVVKLE